MVSRWITATMILTVLTLLGTALVIGQVAQGASNVSEKSATCNLSQYATGENASGGFACKQVGYQELTNTPSITNEASATCSVGQYATGENGTGAFSCSNVPNNVQSCPSSTCILNKVTETVIIPSSNANLFPVINLPTIASTPEVSYYIEENSSASIAAEITPTASNSLYVNGIDYCAGCIAGGFYTLGASDQLLVWSDGTNFNGITSGESVAKCAAGQYMTSENALGAVTCNSPNITFQNNTKTCSDTTATTVLMAGFKLNYTTVGTGKVTVNINFQLTTPATSGLNTKFRIAFGTGSAPACNAAVTGTKVGNQFEIGTVSTVGDFKTIDLSVGVLTLSAATTYWFDIQMFDSTGATWIYSNPQMTVLES